MHEYAMIQDLVDHLQRHLKDQDIGRVLSVRLRMGSSFLEGPVRQAFEMLSVGTLLEGTALVIDEFAFEESCATCGATQTVTTDDLIGHIFICQACGAGQQLDEARGLEIISITVEEETLPVAMGLTPHHHTHEPGEDGHSH
ncbi:MAG: hydrogenase maturation nickel metallochaperone HypA/HybF [Armatimonadota bacterium]